MRGKSDFIALNNHNSSFSIFYSTKTKKKKKIEIESLFWAVEQRMGLRIEYMQSMQEHKNTNK